MMKIYVNAKIYTLQNEIHSADCMVTENGFFKYVGNKNTALNLYPESEIIDLLGKTVLPGFNDSHMHLLNLGQSISQVNLTNINSIENIKKILKAELKTESLILGRGWNQDLFKENRMLTRSDLDEISSEIPIVLLRVCCHVLVANSKAMNLANSYKDSGIFKENDMNIIKSIFPEINKDLIKKYILASSNMLLENGITSVHSDDLSAVEEKNYMLLLKTLEEMSENNLLPIRIYEQTNYDSPTQYITAIKNGYSQDFSSNKMFKLGPLKLLGDGSLGARTAKLKKPYSDDHSTSGILNFTYDNLYKVIKESHINKIDVAIHSIGDEALQNAVDAISKIQTEYPDKTRRHSIVHCQVNSREILSKMKKFNILAHIQPSFLNSDMHIAEKRLGPERVKYSYNYKTMEDVGIKMAFGTDAPVEHVNPFFGIYNAVTRKDRSHQPENGWLPNEAISLYNAIKHYTIDSSYASYEENKKGLIKENFYADFIIIDQDPFEINHKNLIDIKIIKTFVGGILKYER